MQTRAGFVPDGRSPMGRKMIAANMLQHVDKISTTQSEIDDHLTPGTPHLSHLLFVFVFFFFVAVSVPPKKRFCVDPYMEVKEAARRSNLVGPYIDNSKPKTFHMFLLSSAFYLHLLSFPSFLLQEKRYQ
jgi:hypothetical protein